MCRRTRLFKRVIYILLAAMLVLLLSVLSLVWYVGAWKVFFPSTSHDTQPPVLPLNLVSPSILVFSKTNSYRHGDAIDSGRKVFKKMADAEGWSLTFSENGAIFNASDMQHFDAVVFLNVSGDIFNLEQQKVFQDWLEAGGGWLGIHAAGDGSHQGWGWYMDNLIGTQFIAHTFGPHLQAATVEVDDAKHPVMQNLGLAWTHTEEWYSWQQSPRDNGFHILATVDETSYSAKMNLLGLSQDLTMGDHPVVWSNCVGAGRTVYSAFGHNSDTFDNNEHLQLLENSLHWLMGIRGGQCQP